jgi:hypothetical protein
VIGLLKAAGYWDDPAVWRHYGDVENNWGQSGNQQSLAEAALAEKIVNAVDATLIGKCLEAGIEPEGPRAPASIRQAVSLFYESGTDKIATGGRIRDWTAERRREVAETITLAATGDKDVISLTIADMGEGQTPDRVPDTILSLNRSNKMRVPFVQGQFNQGGTGALRFAGHNNLQLVVTRRNQAFGTFDGRDAEWGFTIVRRERPSQTNSRNSIYTFLAPVGAAGAPRKGAILSFAAADLGLFPGAQGAYDRRVTHGTAIKLYEYRFMGERSNILRGRSLFSRLDLLLPQVALPVRVYELRRRSGKLLPQASRETNLDGLRRRLDESKNLEPGFPVTVPFQPMGEKLTAVIYAGRKAGSALEEGGAEDEAASSKRKLGGLKRYRRREGVIFTRNGQTQGTLPKEFFQRDRAKMKPLAEDLLVFVDCDQLSADMREDLFMASRDRLVDNEFKAAIVRELEALLADNEELKALRSERARRELENRLQDDKPLNDVLESLIDSSPNLRQLLRLGTRIQAPFRVVPKVVNTAKLPKLLAFPTFFSLRGAKLEQPLLRSCPINQRARFTFDTDVRDDYFVRAEAERGSFDCIVDSGGSVSLAGPNLRAGVASVTVALPEDVAVGDLVRLRFAVHDAYRQFSAEVHIRVAPEAVKRESRPPRRREPGERRDGPGAPGPSGLSAPHIERVFRVEWEKHGFDEHTALKVKTIDYQDGDPERPIRVFYVNMDNSALLHEASQKRLNVDLARSQFLYGNVLYGLAMLLDDTSRRDRPADDTAAPGVEDAIATSTRALAPFLLTIASLGASELVDRVEVDGLEDAA